MLKIPKNIPKKQSDYTIKLKAKSSDDLLRQLAFDNSLQANVLFSVSSGKIILANEAACKLLGYSKTELLTKSRSTIFDINEGSFKKLLKERAAGGHSTAIVTGIKKNGKVFPCEITSAIFINDYGIEKSITTIVDITQNIRKQKKIDAGKEKIINDNIVAAQAKSDNIEMANREWIKYIAKSSYDVMWDWHIITDEIYVGDSVEELFGYKIQNNTVKSKDVRKYLLPQERDAVVKKLTTTLASNMKTWKDTCRCKRQDGSIAFVTSRASIVRNEKGKAVRLIGATQDISMIHELENKLANQIIMAKKRLEQEIKLKEFQIAEAVKYARDMERSAIGIELHDNINQLLGAAKLYLEMAKKGGEDTEMYLNRTSEYTLTAIDEIRKLTHTLRKDIIKSLGLSQAIHNIIRDTMEINPVKISFKLNFTEHSMNNEFKLNIFRIVQEQINNILKHSKATEAGISLVQNKKFIILSISDNGVGFITTKKGNGIGIDNIVTRAASYNATANFISEPGKGCVLSITFPLADTILKNKKNS
ncbi:MAG: PAS domain S-box protein [Ginsengibacter sp.]